MDKIQDMNKTEYKSLSTPDETRSFDHGKLEMIRIGGGSVGRLTLQPGWRWAKDVKPIVGTEWCEVAHFQYQLTGRLHVKMASGEEFDLWPGDVSMLPPGHDAWVVGDEPVVIIDWYGATEYAKSRIAKAA